MPFDATRYGLSKSQRRALVAATLRKIKHAGNVTTAEARLIFAIFEQAVLDATGFSNVPGAKPERDAARNDAREFLTSQQCAHYLGLVGISYDWAIDKVTRVMRVQ